MGLKEDSKDTTVYSNMVYERRHKRKGRN